MNVYLYRVYLVLSVTLLSFSGVAQKLTANLTNSESKLYFDEIYIGSGVKVVMDNEINNLIYNHQIRVTTPGYLDEYYAISGNKQSQFNEVYTFLNTEKLTKKKESDNYLYFVKVHDLKKAFYEQKVYIAKMGQDIDVSYSNAEKKGEKGNFQAYTVSDAGLNPYQGLHEELLNGLLKDEEFIDSTRVLSSFQNELFIETRILSLNQYYFKESPINAVMAHYKMKSLWYIKNVYGELLDSIEIEVALGEFANNIFSDIYAYNLPVLLNRSLVEFQKTKLFQEYRSLDLTRTDSLPPLHLIKPVNFVQKLEDAEKASVVIKIKDQGHGSGFAITNDGYLITNYHVICGEKEGESLDFVVLFNGKEYKAELVRVDKVNDIALLKIDAVFETAFVLSSEKEFKIYDEVYTIGAPEAIELGQTITKGLISNDRAFGGRNVLQLSMGVNFGNSGGPLFDKEGRLHGVIESKIVGKSAEGLAFAVPTFQISKNLNLVIE